ncbi:MAG: hypothetical protein A3E37_02800 [Candidatus Andersenbacteria bacterium RIFCSPHIGHO2_12_FULL_46_9]|nr:MAG: hypothetical protein UW94_C0007G0031 [Parcubacteria group bacterium GW2011_GWA2_45_14]OGY33028.1 MAG: hypothetical protein A3B76_01285 [Candidatus Andersenbacteria bacterium RIFCSPHIGHO2_02_FULL_46_16]OGY36528.1 MAG: hypothetical protein A3E37_02800 [Candidatus Andersenbacteria bacterium RIFCSPHIGHO2_12_FULL_46_9]OGY37131.1 MAG: hypothetical protein A3I08_02095 [Candidatus Andersenbacteria bacterium RIFCSPLOWO2_02_FULL_46_11]OGY39495.1 MAG: hypothetical protein A3G57_04240 [Candidatus A
MDKIKPWGKSLAIDLAGCDHDKLISPEGLKRFVVEVVTVVDMVAQGECYVERFGQGDLEGYSAMQFIETSSVTVHLDEVGNRAFIDILSCKDFDANKAEEFSKTYFQAQSVKSTIVERG